MVLFPGMVQDLANMAALSDAELVERCLKGEQLAWTQLIVRYQRLVYSVARTLCVDPDDIADVFQATCLDLFKGLHEVREVKALPAWLITVTRRRAVSVLRSKMPWAEEEESAESVETVETIKAVEHEHAIEHALEQLS